jgi:hypothetical protein
LAALGSTSSVPVPPIPDKVHIVSWGRFPCRDDHRLGWAGAQTKLKAKSEKRKTDGVPARRGRNSKGLRFTFYAFRFLTTAPYFAYMSISRFLCLPSIASSADEYASSVI